MSLSLSGNDWDPHSPAWRPCRTASKSRTLFCAPPVLARAIVPLLEQLGRAVVQGSVLFSNSNNRIMVLANTEGTQTAKHTGYLQTCRLQRQRLLCMQPVATAGHVGMISAAKNMAWPFPASDLMILHLGTPSQTPSILC